LVLTALIIVSCGKKGPPLAPIVRIPAAVDKLSAQRVGNDVFITLTVPAKNVDSSIPVDIGRIEIYGYTGRTAPPRTRWVEVGELVATVPVVPPPPEPAPQPAGSETVAAPEPSRGATPGMVITVLDKLTSDELVQGRIATPERGRGAPAIRPVEVPESELLRRFYVAFAFSARGRPGPPGTAAAFPLVELPEPPASIRAFYSESAVSVDWPPSGGIVGFLFNNHLSPEDPPLDDAFEPIATGPAVDGSAASDAAAIPAGPLRYNLYRETEASPLALPAPDAATPWTAARPAPINATPLGSMTFADPIELDRRRCYTVRAVRGTTPNVIEGEASEPACITPVDIFPPAPPAHLVAIADEGGISLIWEPNSETDLAGYLVLRGEASDATLQPLTSSPIVEARFRDTHVTAGKRYVYGVVALDAHLPVPNVSGESNRVEETAR